MSDMQKLIEAVEAGTATINHFRAVWRGYAGSISIHAQNAWATYNGSLDAAKRLHDALLPGWVWNVVDNSATVWPGYPGDPKDHQDGYSDGNPARAWLLAVLRAYQEKEGGE